MMETASHHITRTIETSGDTEVVFFCEFSLLGVSLGDVSAIANLHKESILEADVFKFNYFLSRKIINNQDYLGTFLVSDAGVVGDF